MEPLSKSKLLAWRQCPRRLWLETHEHGLCQDSATAQARFREGDQVGEVARRLYDPQGKGVLIDAWPAGEARGKDSKGTLFAAAFSRTRQLLQSEQPIFEGGFSAEGARAFADVLLPVRHAGQRAWRMVEVKSSTKVKPYHHDDLAVQAFVARAAGVPLVRVALAHVNSQWVYPGGGDYQGLLVETDLTRETFARHDEVRGWVRQAQAVASQPRAPKVATGSHCSDPYECGFFEHCRQGEPQAEHPVAWLPSIQSRALKDFVAARPHAELRDVPDALLNETQLRVKTATLSGQPWFDARGAKLALQSYSRPAYFLDFETFAPAVPLWAGTRPFEQTPFQFSVHRLSRTGRLEHRPFLDLSGYDPAERLAQALIEACEERGQERSPVFAYSASFEKRCIEDLARRCAHMQRPLRALGARIVDLLPVARAHYYHPDQRGSWSIKAVLPALCPELSYDNLDGVQEGGMAVEAFIEAINPQTDMQRKAQIERQLLAYCARDTEALVRLWAAFTGQPIRD